MFPISGHFTKCLARLVLAVPFLVAACDSGPETALEEGWRVSGFANPESVIYDQVEEVLYLSNVNGPPNEKNGQGFISRLSPDGQVLELKWLENLNAPKGMAVFSDTLYISDIDRLAAFDTNTQRIEFYEAPGAKFLNDVAVAPDGAVYVSDMMDNAIYRLKDGVFQIWLQDAALESPNGLLVEDGDLIVGSWGVMTDGFATETPGGMKRVGLSDQSITPITGSLGNLDGVEPAPGGGYTVTDWMVGALWLVDADGNARRLLDLNQGSADHHYMAEAGLIIIPMMADGEVVAYRVIN